mmetsp:Transcript_9459/g.11345  ORF Transcript_9459/g.11345 Transcript_9459/m.11345 type:complete len:315 (+) Transcript_9459:251-1195(+)
MATPLLSLDTQHQDMVHDAKLDYYAKRLATCSSDRLIKVYDILEDQHYQLAADIQSHDGPVWQIDWAHPKFGTILASCSYDGKVIIHKEESPGQWQQIYVYQEMSSSVNSIAWAPHEYDLCLACCSADGKVVVLSHNQNDTWSASLFPEFCPLGVNSVTWAPFGSPQGEGLPAKRLATASCDNMVRIWVLPEGEREWKIEDELKQHTDWVRDVAWAPSIGLPCNTLASCSEDGSVLIWSQDTVPGPWSCTVVTKMDAPVWSVSWSITGSVLAVSSGDSSVTLWKESLDRSWVEINNVNEDLNQPPVSEVADIHS